MSDRLTDQQIETLALAWPWEYAQVERALRAAEREGWDLDDTVRGLDTLAEGFGEDSNPEQVVLAAIQLRHARKTGQLRIDGP